MFNIYVKPIRYSKKGIKKKKLKKILKKINSELELLTITMSEPEVDEISNRTFYYASGTELQICNRKRIEENFTWNHADGIADTDFKENNNSPFVPYWVRINNKFYSNFIDIPSLELNSVFSKEISKSLAYLAQLGEFERLMVYFAIEHHYEVIEGPININLFMRLLKSGELQFNVTYIIELQ